MKTTAPATARTATIQPMMMPTRAPVASPEEEEDSGGGGAVVTTVGGGGGYVPTKAA